MADRTSEHATTLLLVYDQFVCCGRLTRSKSQFSSFLLIDSHRWSSNKWIMRMTDCRQNISICFVLNFFFVSYFDIEQP